MRGIHQSPLDFPHKGPIMRKMFPFDNVIIFCSSPSNATHPAPQMISLPHLPLLANLLYDNISVLSLTELDAIYVYGFYKYHFIYGLWLSCWQNKSTGMALSVYYNELYVSFHMWITFALWQNKKTVYQKVLSKQIGRTPRNHCCSYQISHGTLEIRLESMLHRLIMYPQRIIIRTNSRRI